ncbi:hypothetical protein EMMF5_004827 [Cystobasidiomycetes sp. EMM_F5]
MTDRPSYGATAQSGNGPASSVRREASKPTETTQTKVEPKVFLASERTFFSWLRVALLLGSFALALFNGGDKIGRQMGIVYALISILAVYELYGPTAICVLLFAAVLANFIIRIKHHNGKVKTPKSPWLAAYLNLFMDTQDPTSASMAYFGSSAEDFDMF